MCSGDVGSVRLLRSGDVTTIEMPWGRLLWFASGALGNSDFLTVGRCIIDPGQRNARHYHPNCEEVLQVVEGRVLHSWGEETVEMEVGDTISMPPRVIHNAVNLGDGPAILSICFSTPDRKVVEVDEVAGVAVQ